LKCAKCLHALHAIKVVHRDIKPDNFLIKRMPDQSSHVVLADFGLSTGPNTAQTPNMNCCGTTSYKAPELFKNVEGQDSGDRVYRNAHQQAHINARRYIIKPGWAENTQTNVHTLKST
jgi:serine/threonine protein kinase